MSTPLARGSWARPTFNLPSVSTWITDMDVRETIAGICQKLEIRHTPPKTHIAPENRPSQKKTSIQTIFRCYVGFRYNLEGYEFRSHRMFWQLGGKSLQEGIAGCWATARSFYDRDIPPGPPQNACFDQT